MSNNQPCRYCGTELTRFEKLPDGKWKRYDKNGEHRYDICKAIQNNKNKPVQQQQQQVSSPSGYVAGSSTFPVNEPEPTNNKQGGVSIFSLHTIIAELRKEVRELRKQIETAASVQDSIAQKQELLIQKIGYPTPQPAVELSQERARREIEEANKPNIVKVEQSRDFTCQSCGATFTKGVVNHEKEEYICISCVLKRGKTTDESGVQIKDGQEVKAVSRQRHPTEDELRSVLSNRREIEATIVDGQEKEEIINPMRVSAGWEHLSEAFLCHSCQGKIHNGFINQAGTKVCEPCKLNLEANDAYEKIQKEEDMNHPPLRSIEDINSENDY